MVIFTIFSITLVETNEHTLNTDSSEIASGKLWGPWAGMVRFDLQLYV